MTELHTQMTSEDMQFRKSSFTNGTCVEVATGTNGEVFVRDSKSPQVATLQFTPTEWQAFLMGVKAGEFDS